MLSPFPGMDPYLEDPILWPDVHHALITGVQEQLNSILRPLNYVARVELRTFLFEQDDAGSELYLIPDARVVERSDVGPSGPAPSVVGSVVAMAAPIDITELSGALTARERFLEVRDATNRRVVTIIEMVSPSNKTAGSAGRAAFLKKRTDVADSDVNWLEIDLLRRGTPTFRHTMIPRSAYRAYADRVSTDGRRQLAWPIKLRDRLPILPVPLRPEESDVPLDLQKVLDTAYTRAMYDADVDYRRPPSPPLSDDDETWADALLRSKGFRQ